MILSGDHTRIIQLIDRLNLEVKSLIKCAMDIATYTRGGVDYYTALGMSAFERDLIIEDINKRLEAAAKSPFGMAGF
jgi:hypothetical protein